jgi:hypothetical protein
MMDPITVTIAPERGQVRILARSGPHDLLKAILGPFAASHPRAATTLLEGLALWHQQRLAVVLCADEESDGSALGLCDGLGYGRASLHYDVGLACPVRRPRRRRIQGLGDFSDLRQLSLLEVGR